MKEFLLTLKYPGYTGWQAIGFLRVEARHAQAALNKARRHIKRNFISWGTRGTSILACEEITSCADLWERIATVDTELEEARAKVAALEIERRALRQLGNCIDKPPLK